MHVHARLYHDPTSSVGSCRIDGDVAGVGNLGDALTAPPADVSERPCLGTPGGRLASAQCPWEVAVSPLAIIVTLLPLLLTLGGVMSDLLTVHAARRALDRLAREAAWLFGCESARRQVRSRAAEYFARFAPHVAHRVLIEDDRVVMVELEESVPTRFLWLIGLRTIPVRAGSRRHALAAWEWLHPEEQLTARRQPGDD